MTKKYAINDKDMKQLVPDMGGALATDSITVLGNKVRYMYRDEAWTKEGSVDSGWRFFAGDETPEYMDDDSNIDMYAVNTIANYDPDVIPFLDTPAPCAFVKEGNTYVPVEAPKPS